MSKPSVPILRYSWIGSNKTYLDEPHVRQLSGISVGHYGGNTGSGAVKNEDAALIWKRADGEWEFAVLLDAHNTAESAALIVALLETHETQLISLLNEPNPTVFQKVQAYLLDLFVSDAFRSNCKEVRGETSCLMCLRKGAYLWWLNVGDCLLYLIHPELLRWGQSALNQRNFYEWIGQVNTFDKPVPCYSSGVRELRCGKHVILLTTDGVFEETSAFEHFQSTVYEMESQPVLEEFLRKAHQAGVKDSATLLLWQVDVQHEPSIPSDQPVKAG